MMRLHFSVPKDSQEKEVEVAMALERESVEANSTSEDSIRCLFSLSSWALMIKLSLKAPRRH